MIFDKIFSKENAMFLDGFEMQENRKKTHF